MRPKDNLWARGTFLGYNIFNRMTHRLRFLDFDLPARFDQFALNPLLDFGMSFRFRTSWTKCDLSLHVSISAFTVKGNRSSLRLARSVKRIQIPASRDDEQ